MATETPKTPSLHANTSVMQGGGAYNKSAVVQMTLVDYTESLLQTQLDRFLTSLPSTPALTLRIADLGASEGRNSVALLSAVLRHLEARLPTAMEREYFVMHEDQPDNDFASLLSTLRAPTSYVQSTPNVYTSVIAKSFYERLLPSSSVDIVVSYISLHWMSAIPMPLPGNYMTLNAPTRAALPDICAAWAATAHRDWVTFLRLRATELVDYGAMCLTMAGFADHAVQVAWANVVPSALVECIRLGCLSQASMDKMTLGAYLRTCDEVRAGVAEVPDLELHECQMIDMPIVVPNAKAGAAFMVATTTPSVVSAMTLDERNNQAFYATFAAQLEKQFERSVTMHGVTKPLYALLEMRYLYCALTRKPRAASSSA
ncbi:hypothetical protein SPRG_15246 [Saprolegnia parasitica CBS 223.65]|uniref:SAM dependent carboxyl methyltransferase n=1 Tax=Saprolegnia parasitica (strain CBS 223.65) TaxID=695850 RepID=A0A067BY49_SAPPC|nr:hypothetical protein SPRG_15246 [Saprolegnia parasitica CBS 223.65]KDO19226.1 hypothetical protein SPRG_15246 [Saprolegnia parasitica CBS 223.65]|eukprot:XP_012210060.1 hypothetical protein SPRG_15246 [Saprolegnia parasitica CBS 223.65]